MRRFSQFNRVKFVAFALSIFVIGIASAGPGNYNQQGPKLVSIGEISSKCGQGTSVALSADGNTAIVNGLCGSTPVVLNTGAYVFTRTNGIWSQQAHLEFEDNGIGGLGSRVAVSGDGNTAAIGHSFGNFFVFTRSGGVWSFDSELGGGNCAFAIALSADGNTAACAFGSLAVFERSGGVWSMLGSVTAPILDGQDIVSNSISISADGSTIAWGTNTQFIDDGCDDCAPTFLTEAFLYVITRSGNTITPLQLNDVKAINGSPYSGSGPYSGSPVSLTADGNTLLCAGGLLYRKKGV